jgi:hypothetical protein
VERTPRTVVEKLDDRPVAEIPTEALLMGLSHEDVRVRDHCEQLMGQHEALHVGVLTAALGAPLPDLTRRVLRVLKRGPQAELKSAVKRCLKHKDELVRREAVAAYASLKPSDLLDRLERILYFEDSDWVLHEAIEQLGRTRQLVAVDFLLEHMETWHNRGIRLIVFEQLRALTGKQFGRNERHWRNWWNNHRIVLLGEDEL